VVNWKRQLIMRVFKDQLETDRLLFRTSDATVNTCASGERVGLSAISFLRASEKDAASIPNAHHGTEVMSECG